MMASDNNQQDIAGVGSSNSSSSGSRNRHKNTNNDNANNRGGHYGMYYRNNDKPSSSSSISAANNNSSNSNSAGNSNNHNNKKGANRDGNGKYVCVESSRNVVNQKRVCFICGSYTTLTVNIYEPRPGPNIVEIINERFKVQPLNDDKHLCYSCNNWLINWYSLQPKNDVRPSNDKEYGAGAGANISGAAVDHSSSSHNNGNRRNPSRIESYYSTGGKPQPPLIVTAGNRNYDTKNNYYDYYYYYSSYSNNKNRTNPNVMFNVDNKKRNLVKRNKTQLMGSSRFHSEQNILAIRQLRKKLQKYIYHPKKITTQQYSTILMRPSKSRPSALPLPSPSSPSPSSSSPITSSSSSNAIKTKLKHTKNKYQQYYLNSKSNKKQLNNCKLCGKLLLKRIQKKSNNNPIILYTKNYCFYCRRRRHRHSLSSSSSSKFLIDKRLSIDCSKSSSPVTSQSMQYNNESDVQTNENQTSQFTINEDILKRLYNLGTTIFQELPIQNDSSIILKPILPLIESIFQDDKSYNNNNNNNMFINHELEDDKCEEENNNNNDVIVQFNNVLSEVLPIEFINDEIHSVIKSNGITSSSTSSLMGRINVDDDIDSLAKCNINELFSKLPKSLTITLD